MSFERARFLVTGIPTSTGAGDMQKFFNELKRFLRNLLDSLFREEEDGDVCVNGREYFGSHVPLIHGIIELPNVCTMGDDSQAKIAQNFYAIVQRHFGKCVVVDCAVICGEELQAL